MNKKDINELKGRFKKSKCTFTKLCGCYVNSEKEIILNINETFLNLEEEEFYKYLEVAKKTLSGTLGNNLLQLDFPLEEEDFGGKQQFLMGLRESRLKNEEMMKGFYEAIINEYDEAGNYLILVFHDAYDVMKKTSDNLQVDESEEVYEYIMVALCPVVLSKPGLGYLENEHRIGSRTRDWVVMPPDTGFVFPAFSDRSSDIHSVMFYTKDAKEPHIEVMESILGCGIKTTGVQKKNIFQHIIKTSVNDSEKTEKVISDIQDSFSIMIEEKPEDEDADIILTKTEVKEILEENEIEEEVASKIEEAYEEAFIDELPVVEHLIDKKVLAENEKKKVERALVEQVHILQEKINETEEEKEQESQFDVVVLVDKEKEGKIIKKEIDGEQYLVIPCNDEEAVRINGREIEI